MTFYQLATSEERQKAIYGMTASVDKILKFTVRRTEIYSCPEEKNIPEETWEDRPKG